jgi:hypothetical protein
MPEPTAFVDDVANELDSWPGVRMETRADGVTVVRYHHAELGLLYPERGIAELPFLSVEHDELIEHGEAEPAVATPDSVGVSHALRGPSDVTEVLALFDRRYREVRGDHPPYSSEDSA